MMILPVHSFKSGITFEKFSVLRLKAAEIPELAVCATAAIISSRLFI
jgi:hypothetical protein